MKKYSPQRVVMKRLKSNRNGIGSPGSVICASAEAGPMIGSCSPIGRPTKSPLLTHSCQTNSNWSLRLAQIKYEAMPRSTPSSSSHALGQLGAVLEAAADKPMAAHNRCCPVKRITRVHAADMSPTRADHAFRDHRHNRSCCTCQDRRRIPGRSLSGACISGQPERQRPINFAAIIS